MKNITIAKFLFVTGILSITLWGCNKEEESPFLKDNGKNVNLAYDKIQLSKVEGNAKIETSSANAPSVTKVVSKAICDNCNSTASILIPWAMQESELTIEGLNFGTSGKISISDSKNNPQNSYGFALISWANNQIRLRAGGGLNAIPMDLKFVITTSDSRVATTIISVSPVISSKIFGTSLYSINKRRIEMKFQPLPSGLYPPSRILDANWIPAVGDVWLFPSIVQQSIVVSVSSRTIPVSSNRAGNVDDISYEVGTAEWNNNQEQNSSRQIVIRRTTTIFTNGKKEFSFALRTPVASAFNSVEKGRVASKYYR
jgi:hypothetical protein